MTMNPTLTAITPTEVLLLALLVALIGWEARQAWRSGDPLAAFSPTVILAVILGYYCILGPLQLLSTGEVTDRGVDLRQSLVWGWLGATLFYGCVLFGFHNFPSRLHEKPVQIRSPRWARQVGFWINVIGLTLYAVATGPALIAQLNPLNPLGVLIQKQQSEDGTDLLGAIINYFRLSLNLVIPGTLLMFAAMIYERRGHVMVLLWTLVAMALFTTAGFRWRLVVLLAPMALLWYICRQRRPQLVVLSLTAAALLMISGFIGLTRSYGIGLDLASVRNRDVSDVISEGFVESRIFLTSGEVIRQAPDLNPFVGFTPIINTAAFFIPRQLWPNKPGIEYINRAVAGVYGGSKFAVGAAFMSFAEYYLMFGWPSLILMSLGLGWLLRRLFDWMQLHRNDPSAQVIYALTSCYLYVVVSRGYLPQVFSLFCFVVLPLFFARSYVQEAPGNAPARPRQA